MTAWQIMDDHARWITRVRTASDYHCAIRNVTDHADLLESGVLIDGALDAWGVVEEAIKSPRTFR